MTELKSSERYLLKLQKLICKRKDIFQSLCSKIDLKHDLEIEINNLRNQMEQLDKRISVITIK